MIKEIGSKKNNQLKKILSGLLNSIPEVVLMLSSSFFITLFILIFLARDYLFNGQILYISSLGMLFIYSFLIKRTKIFSNMFLIFGSLVFFTFLISNYFFASSIFSQAFIYYRKKVEYLLNLGVLSFFLYLFFFFLILYGLPAIFAFVKRNKIGSFGLKKFLLSLLNLLAWTVTLGFGIYILFGRYLPGVEDWIVKLLIGLAKLLVPFLGFSLLYLHGNILVRNLIKQIYGNEPTTPAKLS